MDPAAVNDIHFIANGVQTSFRQKQLEPMLRVFYSRTAFQLPDNQRLRISLDTDLTFIREDHIDGQPRRQHKSSLSANWRRNDVGIDAPFSHLPEKDVLRFPYAVLETKLQTHLGQEPPQWLTSLVESHLVHEVPRFSKYLHGACHFYRTRLPLLPWWLAEMNVDIRKPRDQNIGLTRSRSFKPLIDGQYRRAMIEEKQKADQEAVVNLLSDKSTLAESSSAAVKPLPQPVTPSKDYTVVNVPPPPRASEKLSAGHIMKRLLPQESPHRQSMEEPKRSKVKVKAEPKTFFANERTFISWLQFCALLLTVALNLMNFAPDDSTRVVGKWKEDEMGIPC